MLSKHAVLGLVIAAVFTLDGCNQCATFNPFKDYDRTQAVGRTLCRTV